MTRASIRTAVAQSIGQLTGYAPEKIRDTDDLIHDLGVDSMVAARLLVGVEDQLDTLLPEGWESSMAEVRTVAELVQCLALAFAVEPGCSAERMSAELTDRQ